MQKPHELAWWWSQTGNSSQGWPKSNYWNRIRSTVSFCYCAVYFINDDFIKTYICVYQYCACGFLEKDQLYVYFRHV